MAADLLRDLLADARAKLNATAVAAESFHGLTLASDAARDTVRCVKRLAPLPVSVCLSGEPGVGKKSLARALHAESGRTGECVFVDAELHAESTERQATGTENLPRQWVRRAMAGTLVLERLEALPRRMQAQLSSALTDQSGEEGAADVRVISVCHLPGGWTTAHLRPDLLYRVTGVVVDVAPLRRRHEDISAIAADTIAQLNARCGTTKYLTHRAAQMLSQYSWPGNVHELRSVLEQSFHTATDAVEVPALVEPAPDPADVPGAFVVHVGMTVTEVEDRMLAQALAHFAGDKVKAAKAMGITVKTVYNRLARIAEAQTVRRRPLTERPGNLLRLSRNPVNGLAGTCEKRPSFRSAKAIARS